MSIMRVQFILKVSVFFMSTQFVWRSAEANIFQRVANGILAASGYKNPPIHDTVRLVNKETFEYVDDEYMATTPLYCSCAEGDGYTESSNQADRGCSLSFDRINLKLWNHQASGGFNFGADFTTMLSKQISASFGNDWGKRVSRTLGITCFPGRGEETWVGVVPRMGQIVGWAEHFRGKTKLGSEWVNTQFPLKDEYGELKIEMQACRFRRVMKC